MNDIDRGIYSRQLAEVLAAKAGEPYRPSNGTEGELFESAYCANCKRESEPCPILGAAFFLDKGEAGYPAELIIGTDGQPTCTGFQKA